MRITPKIDFVTGSFNTKTVQMYCLGSKNHGIVTLGLKEEKAMGIPIAEIKLHSKDLYVDFKATYNDAVAFGNEIARRWNECQDKK